MKKILFIVVFTLIYAGSTKAQQIYFGPKVGGNLSHFMYNGDNTNFFDTKKMKLASHIGAFVEIQINDFFAVQPELLYSIKGARFNISTENEFESRYVFKYLSLPVLAKYYVSKKVSIEVGPQFAYLLSAKNIEKSDLYSSNLGEEAASVNIKDTMQVYDLGVTAGVGYITDTGFYMTARYNIGLSNIYKDVPNTQNVLKNGAIQLSVGFSME
ncbi:MAG TPA: PorT family protein [Lutibacter sp.]|nr:PorT family protein [Lutibacter sp.]